MASKNGNEETTEILEKKPRKKREKKANPAQGLLDALKFVSQASAKKGTANQTHCRIENGMLTAFDGSITIGCPVAEDLHACPQTFDLLETLAKVKDELSIVQVSEHEICVNSGALSVNVGCSEVETPAPCPNIHTITNAVKTALAFVAPIPRDEKSDVPRSSVLLQTGSAVGTCGMVLGESWHGENLPTMLLPKQLAKVVGGAPFDLAGFGYDGTTCTFWFANGAFVSSIILQENYVNYLPVFETHLTPVKVPNRLFEGLKGLSKFSESGVCEFSESGIFVANSPTSNVKSLYKIEGLPAGMRFISRQLMQAEKMQSVIFDEAANVARFFGGASRMVIRALDEVNE